MGEGKENRVILDFLRLPIDYAKALSYTWIMANVISFEKKVAVLSALVEGCSVRSTVRLTGVSKGAVLRLLVSVGAACTEYHERVVRNVTAKRVQVDEIWSFVGASKRTSPKPKWKPVSAATFGRSRRLKRKAN
jgi:hypothetical protein